MARWLATAMLPIILAGAPALADPVLRWSPADGVVPVGDTITLSVILDEALPVRTIELYVEYDAGLVTTVSGGPGALFNGFNLFQGFTEVDPQNPGEWHGYCVILGASQWTTGPGELYSWTVRGLAEGVCPVVPATLTLLPPGGGSYPGATLPSTTLTVGDDLTGTPAADADIASVVIQPNPFNPTTRVSFSLGESPGGRLEVLDARGRRVAVLWRGEAKEGWSHWNGTDDAGLTVPSGVYSFVLTGDDGRRTQACGTLVR